MPVNHTNINDNRFDVIVIGGGIYGLLIALEASSRDRRVLIVEKGGWGSGTTSAWLRILHGGLRYLQTADLPRFYESVRERSWFLRRFSDYVRPLRCIMPLYESGSHSPLVMKAALTLNDLLSLHRNRGLSKPQQVKRGAILPVTKVLEQLPYVNREGLRSGACWYDAVAVEPQRLLMEIIRACEDNGAVAMSHTEAVGLRLQDDAVAGIEARTLDNQTLCTFRAPIVINAAGHWAPAIAERFGFPPEAAPRNSWAWNVLFDVSCGTESAGAVTARRSGAQTFFVLPWKGKTLVGTGHAAATEGDEANAVPDHLVARFVSQVNEAVPRLGLHESRISQVLAGRLPISRSGPIKLTSRPMIEDHHKAGAKGLYSLWGIKYTTARSVGRKLIDRVLADGG